MLCYVLAQFVDLLGKELKDWPSFLNQITSSNSLDRQMRQTRNELVHFPDNEATRSRLNKRPFLAKAAQNNADLPRQLPRLLANWEIYPKRFWAREARRPNHPKTQMKQPANLGMFYGLRDLRTDRQWWFAESTPNEWLQGQRTTQRHLSHWNSIKT